MISCYELRLGNCVVVNERLEKVSRITRTSIFTTITENENEQFEHTIEQLEPVLLSDDLLKQCGFVFHDYFNFWQLINKDIRSEMDIDRDYHVIDFMRKPILKRLTSLHQLQNVYFVLKGRELEFGKEIVNATLSRKAEVEAKGQSDHVIA